MRTSMKSIKTVLLAGSGVMLYPAFTCDMTIRFSYGPLALLFWFCLYGLIVYSDTVPENRRRNIFSGILGTILSVMTCWGSYLDTVGYVPYLDIRLTAAIVIYAWIYARTLTLLWHALEKLEIKWSAPTHHRQSVPSKWSAVSIADYFLMHPILIMGILLLCWLPCYAAIFPGNFFHDAQDEFAQLNSVFRGDFPRLHSVIIIFLLKTAYMLTGSYNVGIAVYTMVQMMLMSGMFSYILKKLKDQGVNRGILLTSFGYFALFPLIHVLVTATVRDVMFGGLVVFLVFQCYLMCWDPKSFFCSIPKTCSLGLTVALVLNARINIGYSGIPILLFIGLGFIRCYGKQNKKGIAMLLGAMCGGCVALAILLTTVCQPFRKADLAASLSVLTQPIARAYSYEYDNWTDEQRERFETYFDITRMEYTPENADGTKGVCLVDENTFPQFLRFWVSIGMRFPGCYLDGILANTMQMWYPAAVVDGYVESKDWNTDKTLFFFLDYIEPPGSYSGCLPKLQKMYMDLGLKISFEKIPGVSMLFSIGFHVWVLLNCLFYAMYRKARHLYLPIGILVIYVFLSSMVPLVCLRYFSALFFAFPLVLVFTVYARRKS